MADFFNRNKPCQLQPKLSLQFSFLTLASSPRKGRPKPGSISFAANVRYSRKHRLPSLVMLDPQKVPGWKRNGRMSVTGFAEPSAIFLTLRF